MLRSLMFLFVVPTLTITAAGAQTGAPPADSDVLASVRIAEPVLADGRPLPAGTYQVRLTAERPAPNAGQSSEAEQWVEFVASGTVVAREIAEVIRDDDLPDVGASAQRAAEGVRVEMLRGGEFLRISAKRGTVRYLIHLPVVR